MEKSLYDITYTAGEENQTEYFDYTNNLLSKTMSNYMFRNSKTSGFLEKLQAILVFYINSIKLLRVFKNYKILI